MTLSQILRESSMDLKLVPLTPIWTGDAHGISSSLRITGLLGSLRWWFEGIARALDRDACDPTEDPCEYDPDPKKSPFHDLCPACWLFGTTGWARRFRLTGSGLHASDWCVLAAPEVAPSDENWLKSVYRFPGSKVLWGDLLTLRFTRHVPGNRVPGSVILDAVICGLLNTIVRFGALGAKPQNGWGVVNWHEVPQFDRAALAQFITAFPKRDHITDGRFNVSETVFLDFEIRDIGDYMSGTRIPASVRPDYLNRVLPIAYDIRYKSRARDFRTKEGHDRGIRPALKKVLGPRAEDIVGASARTGNRSASRVFVSHLYRRTSSEPYRLRCWVHVPRNLEDQRQAITRTIEKVVTEMFAGSRYNTYLWSDFQKEVP